VTEAKWQNLEIPTGLVKPDASISYSVASDMNRVFFYVDSNQDCFPSQLERLFEWKFTTNTAISKNTMPLAFSNAKSCYDQGYIYFVFIVVSWPNKGRVTYRYCIKTNTWLPLP